MSEANRIGRDRCGSSLTAPDGYIVLWNSPKKTPALNCSGPEEGPATPVARRWMARSAIVIDRRQSDLGTAFAASAMVDGHRNTTMLHDNNTLSASTLPMCRGAVSPRSTTLLSLHMLQSTAAPQRA
jgi:hypothetical protein